MKKPDSDDILVITRSFQFVQDCSYGNHSFSLLAIESVFASCNAFSK